MTGNSYSMPICLSIPAAIELSAGFAEEGGTRTSTSSGAGDGAGRSSRSAGRVSNPVMAMAFTGARPFYSTLRPKRQLVTQIVYHYKRFVEMYHEHVTSAQSPAVEADGLLEERATSAGLMLALVGQHAMGQLRAAHTEHNLSPRQFHLLGLLHDRGAMTQRELGALMRVDPSTLVGLLNPLEAEGFLSRERSADDRRRHVVTLTRSGRKQLERAAKAQ